jgi:hypothetical protein
MSLFNVNNRLTPEQRALLIMNINQYEQINNHIDLLFDMLEDVRENIIRITQPRDNNRNNINNRNNVTTLFNQILNGGYNSIDYDSQRLNNLFDNNSRRSRTNNSVIQNNRFETFLNNFLNTPVIVRPTDEQIQDASVLIRYGDIENPNAEYCPISLDEFDDDDQVRQIIHCGHIFHPNQFQRWFESNTRCPICRYDIRNYVPSSRNMNNNESQNESQRLEQNQNLPQNNQPQSSQQNNQPQNNQPQSSQQNNPSNSISSSRLPISNMEILRNPISNLIEEFSFDINEPSLTNIFLDQITRNLLWSTNNSHIHNTNRDDNSRIIIDPSNNFLFYETVISPSRTQNGTQTRSQTRSQNNGNNNNSNN